MWNPGAHLGILPITTRKIDFVCADQKCSQEVEKEVGGELAWALKDGPYYKRQYSPEMALETQHQDSRKFGKING